MIKRKKRAIGIISLMLVASVSIYAILWALRDNIVFFYSPSEINQKILSDSLEEKSFIRLGGMVKESSIVKLNNGSITFVVTDFNKEIKVFFKGSLVNATRSISATFALVFYDDILLLI